MEIYSKITFTTKKDSSTCIDPTVVNDFFATSVQASSPEPLLVPVTCNTQDCFNIDQLSYRKLVHMLASLNPSTATGLDELPAFTLRKLANEIAPNVLNIINSSIFSGIVPVLWKKAYVSAIWKSKGSYVLHRGFKTYNGWLSHWCSIIIEDNDINQPTNQPTFPYPVLTEIRKILCPPSLTFFLAH